MNEPGQGTAAAAGLRRADLKQDPVAQFSDWFNQARDAGIIEPNAMSIATVGNDGRPTVRTVLLKGFDSRGFVFFTNHGSTKARQISETSQAALLFPWLLQQRQVSIEGTTSRLSTAQTLKYFITRPLDSQLGAWASNQSAVIESRRALEATLETMKQKFSKGRIPLPAFWGGYRVRPQRFEFWQGRTDRLDDRFIFLRQPDDSWKIDRLSP